MQLTTLLPYLAALVTVHGQYFQASQQYFPQQQYAPPQQQFAPQWRQFDQPQSYQSQQQFLPQQPVQVNYQQTPFYPQQQQQMPLPQYQRHVPPPPQQFNPQQLPSPQLQQYSPQQQFNTRNVPTSQVFSQPPPQQQPLQQNFQPRQPYYEGPRVYEQQFKINKPVPVERYLPQQVEPQLPIHQRIRVPAPPERFHPHLADIYFKPVPDRPHTAKRPAIVLIGESLPEGAYGAEEKLADGQHPSYIENTARTMPAETRVVQPQVIVSRKKILHRPTTPRPQQVARIVTTRVPTAAIVNAQPAAAVSKSIVPSNSGPKSASSVFLSCCKMTKVAKSCERICNFDILNKKVLTGMFLGTDPCPQSYGLDLLQCAAQFDDHTTCCRERGVHTTAAGEKCLGFCNMKPGVSFQADISMLPCWGVLNDIKSCFKDSIESRLVV